MFFSSLLKGRRRRQAAAWLLRLEKQPADIAGQTRLQTRFQAWLSADPANAEAFRRARAAWALMAEADVTVGFIRSPEWEKPFRRPWRAALRPLTWPRLTWVMPLAAAAALFLLWRGDADMNGWRADIATGIGEQRQVTLDDGSRLWLGPNSAVDIRFTAAERRVRLLSGQVYAEVAPRGGSEPRPFLVESGNGSVRALGTRFNVDRLPDGIDVTVEEHAVEVTADIGGGQRARTTLTQGQSLRYGDRGMEERRTVDPAQAGAWRRGRLVVDHQSLADLVTELNRYRHGRIVIADKTLSQRVVSGVFDTRDPAVALTTVTTVLGLHSLSLPPFLTLLY